MSYGSRPWRLRPRLRPAAGWAPGGGLLRRAATPVEASAGLEQIAASTGFPGHHSGLLKAHEWSANVGFPGHANPAAAEVVNQSLVPKMFAAAARRVTSAEEAVHTAEAEIERIYQTWRDRGRI